MSWEEAAARTRARLAAEQGAKLGNENPMAEHAPRITRGEVARLLGRSIASVRRLELAGTLRPTKGADGVHYFDRADVERARRTHAKTLPIAPGERAARAWEMFRDGSALVDVVTSLRMHPDEASALHQKFTAPGAVMVPAAACSELASLGFGDSAGRVTAASILAAARTLRARMRELRAAS